MRLTKALLIAVLLFGIGQPASAKTTDPGLLPDDLLYNIDLAIEKIDLALTFSDDDKITKELEFAKERLSEARAMAEKKNIKAMKEAEKEHGRLLTDVKTKIKNINGDLSSLRLYVKTEKEIEEYEQEAEEEFQRISLKIKIEADGNLTEEQIQQIKAIISNLKGQAGEVKIEIDNQKTKAKIKIKNKTGKSDQKIEEETEEIEEEEGLTEEQKEHALDLIAELREEYNETLSEARDEGISIPSGIFDAFNASLAKAIREYNNGNYSESIRFSKEADLQLEIVEERIEDSLKSVEIEGARNKISVEIEEGRARVETEIGGVEKEFTVFSTNREVLVSEIMNKTGLNRTEINNILEIENHEKD